jgi:hypothetical protein
MRRWVVAALAVLPSLAWLVEAARDAYDARTDARRAISVLERVTGQSGAIDAIRRSSPPQARLSSGLAPRVTAVLGRCGIPPSAVLSLSPESAAGAGAVTQRAALTLRSVTLPQVGAFLGAWRSEEPAWIIASIEVSPISEEASVPGGDLPLRALIGLEALRGQERSEHRAGDDK